MTARTEPLKLTLEEYAATAKRISHEWMRHVGYPQAAVDIAERLLAEDTPLDALYNLDDADAARDLSDASELVEFAMERLVVARDDAAELRAALWGLYYAVDKHFGPPSMSNTHMPLAVRKAFEAAQDSLFPHITSEGES